MPQLGAKRNRIEAAPQEDGERFWSLFQAVSVGIVLSGPAAEVKLCNQAALHLLGVTEDQLTGKTSLDPEWKAINEDGSPCPGEDHPIPRAIATRHPVRDVVMGVYRPQIQDWAWLLVNAEPQVAADGGVTEVVCTFIDITERKRALALLTGWKNRFEAANRASGQILYDWDAVTNDIAWGGDYERILGYSAEEMTGGLAHWMELVHPDDRLAFRNEIDRVIATKEPFHLEYRVRTKSGSYLLTRNHGYFYLDEAGEIVRTAGVVSDITEQKQAEGELRTSEERFRNAFAHAATGMALTNLEGRFVEVNRAYCEITGYSAEELTTLDFASITHREDRPAKMRLVQQMLAGEIPSFVIEKRYVRKNGGVVWVRNSVSLLRDSKHHPLHIIARVEDITERKHAEQAVAPAYGADAASAR